ncbi:Lrp/AsnC family transcriptional regulator [Paraburkholderia sp. BL10I2N1]|uniref:Lrp/AsnC family transcriptional regulator n=1 Tax=Paraburkholderia sp. BL10I2N1 TaxID=1938796 RepID=UPI00106128FC|nr:Lrp/AsnC family transcriptional regulator [Paraburkholderia sp. BL10I2N1]TDN58840.1 AsnC family transcriptional regulator [Paraburkholderia sp. BL10I2N1]
MTEGKIQLDKIDQRIIDILRLDGRISYRELSERVNLTPRPCQARVQRLEALGVIKGYRAVVRLPQDEPPVILLAQIALGDHVRSQEMFEEEVRSNPAVLDCWLVSGVFDFLVRIACRNLAEYHALANAWLANPRFNVEKVTTTTELQTIKRSTG